MRTILRIAFRNTRRQKKRSFLLGGAIAFGVMVITLLNAFTAGMVETLKVNFSDVFGGHIYVTGKELTKSGRVINAIGDDAVMQSALEQTQPYVQQINKRSQAFGELVFGSKSTMQRIDGIDWKNEVGLSESLQVLQGTLDELNDPHTLILPKTVAEKLGVAVGETVLVRLSTVTGQQNVGEMRLIAMIEDQTNYGLSTGYAHLAYLNELLGLEPTAYQMLHMFLRDMKGIDHVADIVHGNLALKAAVEPRMKMGFHSDPDAEDNNEDDAEDRFARMFGNRKSQEKPWKGTKFSVTTLNDIMGPVMSMVGVLNTIGLVVFLILLIITMVGIMNTFRMIMLERTQEIGTMRACGMQRSMVRNIFMAEALMIGMGGAFAGMMAAGMAMLALRFIKFSNSSVLQFFLSNGRFRFQVLPGSVLINLVLLLLMTSIAAYMPARAAARLRPADALRAQF